MLHPASGRVQRASRGAFERVWQHEGWVLNEDHVPKKSALDAVPQRPTERDNKAAWVEWAVHNGADRAEAEASTKADLIEAYGG